MKVVLRVSGSSKVRPTEKFLIGEVSGPGDKEARAREMALDYLANILGIEAKPERLERKEGAAERFTFVYEEATSGGGGESADGYEHEPDGQKLN